MQVQPTTSTYNLSLVFTIAVVVSIAIQALVFIGVFLVVARTLKKIEELTTGLSGKTTPIVNDVRLIVEDLAPKIRKISSEVAELTEAVRNQAMHVNSTVDDVVGRTHAQAVKVDDMVSAVIGGVAHAGATIQSGVTRPVRRVSALWNGIRAGLGELKSRERPEPQNRPGTRVQPEPDSRPQGNVQTESHNPPVEHASNLDV